MDWNRSIVKREVVVIIAGLFVVSVLGTATMGVLAQTQKNEPNDTRANATSIEGAPANGTLSPPGDVDWYSFRATEGETVSILATKPDTNRTDVILKFYAPDSEEYFLLEQLSRSDRRFQEVFTARQSGVYYVKIHTQLLGSDVSGERVPYMIGLVNETATPDSQTESAGMQRKTEPNDAYRAATHIQGTRITGQISVSGDRDWYWFRASKGEKVSVLIDAPLGQPRLGLALYEPNGSRIALDGMFVGEERAQVTTTVNETGIYHVYVSTEAGKSGTQYTLYIPAKAAPTPTPTPTPVGWPGQSPSSPASVTVSSPTQSPTTANTAGGNGGSDDGTTTNAGDMTDRETSETFGTGFGAIGGLIALLAAALLAARQQTK